MNRYYKIYAVLSLIIGATVYFYLTQIDGTYVNRPIQYITDPTQIKLEHHVYSPGQELRGYISFCKHSSTIGKTYWELTDGQLIALAPKTGAAPAGCYNNVLFDIGPVPTYLSADTAYLSGEVDYQVNPLRTVRIALKTQSFKIQ